jgi:kynureninase
VGYGAGAAAFAGATYDPTSNYRGAAVFAFHEREGLTAERLRAINREQVALLHHSFDRLDVDPAVAAVEPLPAERRAGFLAIRTPHAQEWTRALADRGVHTDARGAVLRLGPAPYLRDDQLIAAIHALGEIVRSFPRATPATRS